MSGCGTASADALVRSLIGVADCQAAALGRDGWQGLAGSGMFAALLTGLLTLAVAREGYRLLAGRGLVDPAEAVALLLRFGVVIALTSSWTAYDRLVYRVAMTGPAEVADAIFPSAGIDGERLSARLANAYDAIVTEPPGTDADAAPGAGKAAANSETMPAAKDDELPGAGRRGAGAILLVTGAGTWIAARFALALLLAIGPLALVALLFEASAGLFVGWLRALAGAALAGLVIPLSLALELQMLVGPVAAAARAGTASVPGLGAIVWIFALVDVALIVAVQRMAGGLRLPGRRAILLHRGERGERGAAVSAPASPSPRVDAAMLRASPPPSPAAPPRALAIVHAVQARRPRAMVTVEARSSLAAALPRASQRVVHIGDLDRKAAGRRRFTGKRLELGS